jgi:hypothetical protein
MNLYKSYKVKGYQYRIPRPKRSFQISADLKLSVCNHKSRWIIAFARGHERVFSTCDRLNRSDALALINFLSDYVNLIKPTEATVLNASAKARTNGIIRDVAALTGLAVTPHKTGE